MGCYVNPRDGSDKFTWLKKNGAETSGPGKITETHLPVCLVDNGLFEAAGIAFDEGELQAFNQPHDIRPRWWFVVPKAALYEVSDLKNYER